MANQDPQPEIYSTNHDFAATAAAGTTNQQTIFTNQANNEEVRIYAVSVEILDTSGAAASATDNIDFSIAIQVGPNNVPSNKFDVGWVHTNIANGGQPLAFPTPILALFQQPLAVTVEVETTLVGGSETRTVNVNLIGELAIQKVACHTCGFDHPINKRCPQCGGRQL